MTPTPETAVDPCPVEAVFPDQRIPCILSRGHEPPHKYTPEPAPETGTARIRWEDIASPIDAIASRGYVGKLERRSFIIYKPEFDGSQYRSLCLIGDGLGEFLYDDD